MFSSMSCRQISQAREAACRGLLSTMLARPQQTKIIKMPCL
jgi:hypothetical protein